MRVKFKLYRFYTSLEDGQPTKERMLVGEFSGLMIPISINERLSVLGDLSFAEFKLYPLQPINVLVSDEVEVGEKVYSVVSVTPSQTKFITCSILLRGDGS